MHNTESKDEYLDEEEANGVINIDFADSKNLSTIYHAQFKATFKSIREYVLNNIQPQECISENITSCFEDRKDEDDGD